MRTMKRRDVHLFAATAAGASLLVWFWVQIRGPWIVLASIVAASLVAAGLMPLLARSRATPFVQDAWAACVGLVVAFGTLLLGYPLLATSVLSAACGAALHRSLIYRKWLRANPPPEELPVTFRLVKLGPSVLELHLVNSGEASWTAPRVTLEALADWTPDDEGFGYELTPGWEAIPNAKGLAFEHRTLHLVPGTGTRIARLTLPSPYDEADTILLLAHVEGTGRDPYPFGDQVRLDAPRPSAPA